MTRNLPHVIPGLTRNLSKRSATKSPFYAFKRGRCHFLNRGLPHSRPPEPDFVPDHSGRSRPLVISTEHPRVENSSSTPRGTFPPIIVPPPVLQHVPGNVSGHFRSPCRAKGLIRRGSRLHLHTLSVSSDSAYFNSTTQMNAYLSIPPPSPLPVDS